MTHSDQETINVIKILVIANMLLLSYDKNKKFFIPYEILPEKKKTAISSDIEELLIKASDIKGKVNVSEFFFVSSKKKSKLQDLHDSLLKVEYPYIRWDQ